MRAGFILLYFASSAGPETLFPGGDKRPAVMASCPAGRAFRPQDSVSPGRDVRSLWHGESEGESGELQDLPSPHSHSPPINWGTLPLNPTVEELRIEELRVVPSPDRPVPPTSHPSGPPDPGHPLAVPPQGTGLPAGEGLWMWAGGLKRSAGLIPAGDG